MRTINQQNPIKKQIIVIRTKNVPDYQLRSCELYFSLSIYSIFNLQVKVLISSIDNSCIEVVLRCMAVEGDGIGPHDLNDGGILANVMAAGFKGMHALDMGIILLQARCIKI